MSKTTLSFCFLASLSACGSTETIEDFVEDGSTSGDLAVDPEDDLVAPPAGSDDDESDDGDDDDEDPTGRITFVGHEDGDLIVHARVTDELLQAYPEAEHLEMRLGESQRVIVLKGGDDEILEWMLLERSASDYFGVDSEAVKLYFPFPFLPDLKLCFVEPCYPYGEWSGAGDVPNHFELTGIPGEVTRMRGVVDGVNVGADIYVAEQVMVPFQEQPLAPAAEARLVQVAAMTNDLQSLEPELEPLIDCTKCFAMGFIMLGDGAMCSATWAIGPCYHFGTGWQSFWEECHGICHD